MFAEKPLMNYLQILVVVTAVAVVVQIGVLVALLVTIQKSASRMSALGSELKDRVMPLAGNAKAMLSEVKATTTTIAANVTAITNRILSQIERVDAAVGDITETARLQVVRGQKGLNRTKSHIDETRASIHGVVRPLLLLSEALRANPLSLVLQALKAIASETRTPSEPPEVPS